MGAARVKLQLGYLKTLFGDYIGPRHVVTLRHIPPEELAPSERGDAWLDWEERPGPDAAPKASNPTGHQLIQVCYVAATEG